MYFAYVLAIWYKKYCPTFSSMVHCLLWDSEKNYGLQKYMKGVGRLLGGMLLLWTMLVNIRLQYMISTSQKLKVRTTQNISSIWENTVKFIVSILMHKQVFQFKVSMKNKLCCHKICCVENKMQLIAIICENECSFLLCTVVRTYVNSFIKQYISLVMS